VAHSGCEGTVPGSLEGILTALKLKVDFIEFDLRLYKGEVYLSHDPLDTDHLDRYLTFRYVLELLALEKVRLNCDLKEKEVLGYTIKLLREYNMEDRTVFTGEYWTLAETNVKYKYFLNVGRADLKLCTDKIGECEANKMIDFFMHCEDDEMEAFNLDYRSISPEVEEKLYNAGIPISYWTVDDPKEIERMLENHAFAITTNRIADAILARERIQG
jgi:glycerophosphoryl diester phosphodiesterase